MRCSCGHALARGGDLVAMPTPIDAERSFSAVPIGLAIGGRSTQLNATVHRLRNPHGRGFDLVTVAEAGGATAVGHGPTSEATWFPGYAWRILTCAACGAHVGWRFTEEDGLIASMARASHYYGHAGQRGGEGGRGGERTAGGKEMASDASSFVGLALEKMRFSRGDLTFRWSPEDEAFVAAAVARASRQKSEREL